MFKHLCARRAAVLLALLLAAACAAPSAATAPNLPFPSAESARDAAANLPPISGVAGALLEPLNTAGLRVAPGELITLESGEERIEQRLLDISGLAILTLQSTPAGEMRQLARANVPFTGAALSSAALRVRALLHLMSLTLPLPRGLPLTSSVGERRILTWERTVNGVEVPGDGTRVVMSASGALVGISIDESALAVQAGTPRSAAQARTAALALLPSGAVLSGTPKLGWVHPAIEGGDEELLSEPRQLAWRLRGTLADGTPFELHLEAMRLSLIGWDWAR